MKIPLVKAKEKTDYGTKFMIEMIKLITYICLVGCFRGYDTQANAIDQSVWFSNNENGLGDGAVIDYSHRGSGRLDRISMQIGSDNRLNWKPRRRSSSSHNATLFMNQAI